MHHLQLSAFPEELLERILALSVVAPLVQTPRPQWHQRSNPNLVRGRLAPLLVCKKFFRICTPLFYHTVHITSPAQLHKLLSIALRPNVYLATYIHRLFFAGIWAEGGELLSMCGNNIKMLDITLDVTQLAPGVYAHRERDLDAEDFCDGLKDITSSLTHLVLRKSNNVYLTQPKPRHVLGEIAKAMRHWDNLVCHSLSAFPISFKVQSITGPRRYSFSSIRRLRSCIIDPYSTTIPTSKFTRNPRRSDNFTHPCLNYPSQAPHFLHPPP